VLPLSVLLPFDLCGPVSWCYLRAGWGMKVLTLSVGEVRAGGAEGARVMSFLSWVLCLGYCLLFWSGSGEGEPASLQAWTPQLNHWPLQWGFFGHRLQYMCVVLRLAQRSVLRLTRLLVSKNTILQFCMYALQKTISNIYI